MRCPAGQLTYNSSATMQSALFGDSTLRGMQSTMSEFTSRTFGSMNLTDLGVTMDKDGLLSLDSTKLNTKLQSNPTAITDMFVTGGSSLLQDQIGQIENNATALQKRLEDQFSALEAAMSQLNGQSSYITQMMSQTSTNG